jgi:hypothetical protein
VSGAKISTIGNATSQPVSHDPTQSATNPSPKLIARHVAMQVTNDVIIPLKISPNKIGAALGGNILLLSHEGCI